MSFNLHLIALALPVVLAVAGAAILAGALVVAGVSRLRRPRPLLDEPMSAEASVTTVGGALLALQRIAPGLDVSFCVGVGPSAVAIRLDDPAHSGDAELRSSVIRGPLASGLGMLATEGGRYPRHERIHGRDHLEDDPFAGIGVGLGIVAAVPVESSATGDGWSFAVFRSDSTDGHATDRLVDAVGALDTEYLRQALQAHAAAELLAELGRQSHRLDALSRAPAIATPQRAAVQQPPPSPAHHEEPTQREVASAEPAAAESASEAPSTGASGEDAWLLWLQRREGMQWPLSDPDALTEAEWEALTFLSVGDGPVLVVGEPGAGKEFVARAIHHSSKRTDARLAVLDCGELPASLVEIELFGDGDQVGLAELARGGAVIIKSASLLSAQQLDMVIRRLATLSVRIYFLERYRGPEGGIPSSVPASIRDAVGKRFVHLTPLRERPDDILRYASYFLRVAVTRYDLRIDGITDSAADLLRQLDYPVNFNDLRGLMVSAALRAESGIINVRDLVGPTPEEAARRIATLDDEDERVRLLAALRETGGNKSEAARLLQMSRGRLLRRLQKHGLL